MNMMGRLRDEDATDVERWLLDSAAEDAPGPGAREAALVAIAAGVVATSSAAAAAPVASGATLGAAGATSGAKATGSLLTVAALKWLGVGAIAGTVVASVASVASVATHPVAHTTTSVAASPAKIIAPPPANAPQPAVPAVTPPPEASAEAVAPPPEASVEAVAPPPEASAEARAPSPSSVELHPAPDVPSNAAPARQSSRAQATNTAPSVGALPTAAAGNSVVDEVASLDRARVALARHDAAKALELLSAHRARFGGGALEPEAVVLRVRALLDVGQRDRATSVAEAFLRAHPGTPQAARLRTLVGGGR
jgi:hypothetical protein